MYRDFIYLDTDRVQSIIAQLQQGLLDQIAEGKTKEVSGRLRLTVDLLTLLLPVGGAAEAGHKSATDLRESKVLHDYAFTVALDSLRDRGFLLEDTPNPIPETGFILAEGSVRIFDYETLGKVMENFDELDLFFKPAQSKNEANKRRNSDRNRRIKGMTVLIDAFFENAIRVKLTSSEGYSFVGPLSREHLRENMQDLIFKHGSRPEGQWIMLAEITRGPLRRQPPETQLRHLMGEEQTAGGEQARPFELLNRMIGVFDAFQELIGSAYGFDVYVSPIAIYREVHPHV